MSSFRALGKVGICLCVYFSLQAQSTPDELLRRVRKEISGSVARSRPSTMRCAARLPTSACRSKTFSRMLNIRSPFLNRLERPMRLS